MAEVVEGDGYGSGLESDDAGLEIHQQQDFLFVIIAAKYGPFLVLGPFADAPIFLFDMQLQIRSGAKI